ncbi:MAG: hypothetical protein NUV46_00070 [Nanoarchaeota archaeon]|nr:hypothetical protein [Nanoarchaeota archaeon]
MGKEKSVTFLAQDKVSISVYRKISQEYIQSNLEESLRGLNEASMVLNSDKEKDKRNVEYLVMELNRNLTKYEKGILDAKKLQINVENEENNFKEMTKRHKKAFEYINLQ